MVDCNVCKCVAKLCAVSGDEEAAMTFASRLKCEACKRLFSGYHGTKGCAEHFKGHGKDSLYDRYMDYVESQGQDEETGARQKGQSPTTQESMKHARRS